MSLSVRGPMLGSVLAAGIFIAAPRGRDARVHTTPPDPRAAIFVQRGCTECHTITALGARASNDVGPDLTFAYADVVVRYGVNLESFFANPPGVMRMMLAAHLHLNPVDRDSMVHVLKRLYEERRADMDERVPSFPPGARRHDALLGLR